MIKNLIAGNLIKVPLVRKNGKLWSGSWDTHPSMVWAEIDSKEAKQGFWEYSQWYKTHGQYLYGMSKKSHM